ncbi:4-(cytidine 5'-diphospho)-2-C-methyl-D-erythritol kinase [Luteococcus peritonei]
MMSDDPSRLWSPAEDAPVRVRVPAKVNLALCVGPLGADGYHPLGTVFHALSLHDEVLAAPGEPGEVTLQVSGETSADVPVDESNLAVRAARLLAAEFGTPELGVRLQLKKQIPVAGGMAGGSADAAGALLACSVLWDLDTGPDDLHALAARLGADVPFGLVGGNAIGRGRGDQLVPLLSCGIYHWVLAFAHGGLSTPQVFGRFDEMLEQGRASSGTEVPAEVAEALAKADPFALGKALRNNLEAPALDLRPELAETLAAGRAAGALGAIVSGSGPTCAFLAESESRAMDLATELGRLEQVAATRRATGPAQGARLL